jgi:hypothetical protein
MNRRKGKQKYCSYDPRGLPTTSVLSYPNYEVNKKFEIRILALDIPNLTSIYKRYDTSDIENGKVK